MYNRYIPQGDGSFRRQTLKDASEPSGPSRQTPAPEPKPVPPEPPKPHPLPPRPPRTPEGQRLGAFLRQLLPKNFDTEDLIVVLLLLLLSGDCKEDQDTALLTLVLYLFL